MSAHFFKDHAPEDDSGVLSVNHRGYSAVAPENTLPAYQLSKEMGFRFVETDVSFTSDGIPVLLHDASIDRTSDGSGKIAEMTFEEVRQYDFGSWKSEEYAGTRIPTLEEFLELCRKLSLYPYIELKKNGNYTREQVESIVDLVEKHGMKEYTSYISFSAEYLGYVRDRDPSARLGYLRSKASLEDLKICSGLKTALNQVFYDVKYSTVTQEICHSFRKASIPMEVWTVNQIQSILSMNPYISGITSDSQVAGRVLTEKKKAQEAQKQTQETKKFAQEAQKQTQETKKLAQEAQSNPEKAGLWSRFKKIFYALLH